MQSPLLFFNILAQSDAKCAKKEGEDDNTKHLRLLQAVAVRMPVLSRHLDRATFINLPDG